MIQGISNLTVNQLRQRILTFDRSYVDDWNTWLRIQRNYPLNDVAVEFGRVLRRWQACRPNTMRRCRGEAVHKAPYLEDLLRKGVDALSGLSSFEFCHADAINDDIENALLELWGIFRDLSYKGRSRNGLAGVVGISKAVLLLTEGRVGPAFDSQVRAKLGIGDIATAKSWIMNLRNVAKDIARLELLNQCSLREVVPKEFSGLHYGRLYDMILGPGSPSLA